MAYEPRTYRRFSTPSGLVGFEVAVAETDLLVHARTDLTAEALELAREARAAISGYIDRTPRFAESFVPFPVEAGAPAIVRGMARAAELAGVGPMASVAGAVAEHVARGLSALSAEVVVENGGDVFLVGDHDRLVGVWAGAAGARGLGVRIGAPLMPVAVATSSGTIGPSVSLGSADTATIVAASGALADAAASAVGNLIHTAEDIEPGLARARSIPGVAAAVVSIGGAVGAWGPIELVPVAPESGRER